MNDNTRSLPYFTSPSITLASEAHCEGETTFSSDESDSYESCVSEQESPDVATSFDSEKTERRQHSSISHCDSKICVANDIGVKEQFCDGFPNLPQILQCSIPANEEDFETLRKNWNGPEATTRTRRRSDSEEDFAERAHRTATHLTSAHVARSIQAKTNFSDLPDLPHLNEVCRNPEGNQSSLQSSASEVSSVPPTILLSRTESTFENDETLFKADEAILPNLIRNTSNSNVRNPGEIIPESKIQSDCYSAGGTDDKDPVYRDELKKNTDNSRNDSGKSSKLSSELVVNSWPCHKCSESECRHRSKHEYFYGKGSSSFGKRHTCAEGNRILSAVKDGDGQADGPILTDVGVAKRTPGVEVGLSQSSVCSETPLSPATQPHRSNLAKETTEVSLARSCDRRNECNNDTELNSPQTECTAIKSEKTVIETELFETDLIVREGKLNRNKNKAFQPVAGESERVACSSSRVNRTDSARLIVPPAVTVGRSASFSEKYFVKPSEDAQPSSRQRCHSTSSFRSYGEYFHFGPLKKLINSPKKTNSMNMANASPAYSESSSVNSNIENKKNTIIDKISSNIARKISKQGKCETDPKIPQNLESKEFREAMASATAACNGRAGSNPYLVCYEELLKLFLCPHCGQLMSPPLPQCRKGHLVCSQCKLGTKNACPICKQRYAEGYNVMMGQVYQLLKLPCRFSPHGCARLLLQRDKAEHEADCAYRPVCCHYATAGCSLQLPYKQMLEHINTCTYKSTS